MRGLMPCRWGIYWWLRRQGGGVSVITSVNSCSAGGRLSEPARPLFEYAKERLWTAFGDPSAHSKAGPNCDQPAQARQGDPFGALRDLDALDPARPCF
jgi:hypothetical protein